MDTAIHALNTALTFVHDLVYRPLRSLPPFWSLTVLAFLTGSLMVLAFYHLSDQARIKQIKNKITGNLLAIRIFQNDLRVLLRIQGRILADTLVYMKYTAKPMVVLMVPLILILIQLNGRYSIRPVREGESVLVKVTCRDRTVFAGALSAELDVPAGLTVETAGVRIPSEREIAWRVLADRRGEYMITVRVNGQTATKTLVVGPGMPMLSPIRTGAGVYNMLLSPGEAPLDPATAIEAVEVTYPRRRITVWNRTVHWLVQFFILSIVFGFLQKYILGIQI